MLSESTLSSKAEHGYITGTDIVSDVCCALGLWTWEDMESNNLDYLGESVDRLIKNYDWKTYTRNLLNAGVSVERWRELAPTTNGLDMQARAGASEYLLGDFLEIEEQNIFSCIVANVKNSATNALTDCYPYNPDAANAPQDLKDAIRRDVDWTYDNMRDKWLHGDRSSYGALGEISKHFTGAYHDCDHNKKDDILGIVFTEDEARDFLGYDIEDGEEVRQEGLQEAVTAHLLRKVADRRKEQGRKRGERIEAQERNQKAEEERQEKLREEARERKRKAGV